MTEDATTARGLRGLLAGDVVDVAGELLGWRLVTEFGGTTTEIVICEVEAYGGTEDSASHAYRGRTVRNGSMFREPGTLYVYRSYGVHWCANIVTGPEGEASAVLLRGGAPTVGVEVMERRRGRSDHLSDGPGKVCRGSRYHRRPRWHVGHRRTRPPDQRSAAGGRCDRLGTSRRHHDGGRPSLEVRRTGRGRV